MGIGKIYTCHAIGCNVNNAQDENLETYLYCENHFTLNESEATA